MYFGPGISVGRRRVSYGDSDAQAFIAATGITGTTEVSAINKLVANLKTYGLWSKMKAIYPFVSDTKNLLSYTENFTNAYWSKNTTVTANVTTAPDGTNTGNQNSGAGNIYTLGPTLSAQAYILSIYAKANTTTSFELVLATAGFSLGFKCSFDLTNGTAGTVTNYGGLTGTASISNAGNGWYRCSISGVVTAAQYYIQLTTNANAFYIWGAQLEQSASATTYQPIATTPANRFVSQFKYNLKDPRDLDAAFRLAFNGTWAYTKQGATPNGVNGYADTFFVPSGNLTATSQSSSIYSRTNSNYGGSPNVDFSSVTSGIGNFSLSAGLNTAGINAFVRYGLTQDVRNTSAQQYDGYFVGSRTANNVLKLWRSNVQLVGTTTTTETGISTLASVIGGERTGASTVTNYASRQYAFAHTSDGLTDTEASNLYTSVQTFQQDLSRQVGVPIVSDSDAQSFLNAAVITDTTQANAINTLVVGLKNASLWTKMKAIYPFVGGTATTHKWNLKDPRDLDAAYRLAFSGAWTHSSTGALPNGANAYANTYLNPTTTFADKPLGIGAYVNTVSTFTNDKHIIGAYSGASNYSSIQVNSSTAMQFNMYAGFTATLTASPSARGYMLWTNNGTTAYAYVNNQSTSGTLNGTNRPNVNYSLGGINVNGTTQQFVNNQFCAGYITDYLTSTESSSLYNLLQSFQTTLGRQV